MKIFTVKLCWIFFVIPLRSRWSGCWRTFLSSFYWLRTGELSIFLVVMLRSVHWENLLVEIVYSWWIETSRIYTPQSSRRSNRMRYFSMNSIFKVYVYVGWYHVGIHDAWRWCHQKSIRSFHRVGMVCVSATIHSSHMILWLYTNWSVYSLSRHQRPP